MKIATTLIVTCLASQCFAVPSFAKAKTETTVEVQKKTTLSGDDVRAFASIFELGFKNEELRYGALHIQFLMENYPLSVPKCVVTATKSGLSGNDALNLSKDMGHKSFRSSDGNLEISCGTATVYPGKNGELRTNVPFCNIVQR